MSRINFELFQNLDNIEGFIQFQIGKGKKHQPSIYMNKEAFDCVRGIIWNKYREFGSQEKVNDIKNDDWQRILVGFEEALISLKTCSDTTELVKVLSISNHLLNQKNRIFEQLDALKIFIEALMNWVKANLKKEKHILVIDHAL
jgi:hypothetical protein